jgi:hypothetical protein
MNKIIRLCFIACIFLFSCKSAKESDANNQAEGRVPVTTVHPVVQTLSDSVELNATSVFFGENFCEINYKRIFEGS